MQTDIIDYRNGQYQGSTNSLKQRHGLGIFIDDDLAFHISHWYNNKLNGPTLLYFSHGKYIYGDWKLNEPHGLNIYRSGDTVLLSKYKHGLPSERCLLIFEKYNFACVMNETDQQWEILQSGPLPNHKVLIKYIQQIGLPVADHHFSLTKYACALSNSNTQIKTFPCLSNYCYFGFINGLGIIFNSNNGVVSVGHHRNQEVCQFGGKFEGTRMSAEGNFDQGEVVEYLGARPTNKIHSIFQKIHKKGINFYNQYFDSKAKVFNLIDNMIRNKLQDIAQEGRKSQQFKHINLNDSLDYKEYDEGESVKLTQNRQKMYSPPKKPLDRNISKFNPSHRKTQQSKRYTNELPPRSKGREITKPIPEKGFYVRQFQDKNSQQFTLSPLKTKKTQYGDQIQNLNIDKSRERSYLKDKPKVNEQYKSSRYTKINYFKPENAPPKPNNNQQVDRYTPIKKEETSTFANIGLSLRNKNSYSKMYHQQSEIEDEESNRQKNNKLPTFKGLLQEKRLQGQEKPDIQVQNLQETSTFQKNHLQQLISKSSINQVNSKQEKTQIGNTPIQKKRSSSSIKRPTYQDIEQRRKRILKQFKQLNEENINKKSAQMIDSPAKFDDINITSKQSRESHFGCMPLSISNKNVQKNLTPLKKKNQNIQQTEEGHKSFKKTPLKQRNENIFLPQQIPKHPKMNSYIQEQIQNRNSFVFQRVNSEMTLPSPFDIKPPNKDQSQSSNIPQISQSSMTPTRQKRTYQYLFE